MADHGSGPIRVFIADDHSIVRHGLTAYLGLTGDIEVVGEAADGAEAVRAITELVAAGRGPDVVLVDLVMPRLDGVGVTQALRLLPEPPRVMILSSFGDVAQLRSALRAGVSGYVLKSASAEEIAAAVHAVSSGRLHLDAALSASLTAAVAPSGIPVSFTDREHEVVALVARGMSNKRIAASLGISERTARTTSVMSSASWHWIRGCSWRALVPTLREGYKRKHDNSPDKH